MIATIAEVLPLVCATGLLRLPSSPLNLIGVHFFEPEQCVVPPTN